MQGVGRSVRGADKRDHRGEKFDVLACHFQFWDKAKCFTEWPHQSTRGKVAPSIILRCYELACLPRVTQGLEPPQIGKASCRESVCKYVSILGVADSIKKK